MTARNDLEDRLDDLEVSYGVEEGLALAIMLGVEEEWEVDPDTLESTRMDPSGLSTAIIADTERRESISGVEVFTEEDVSAFDARLADALDGLLADGGPELDAEDVVEYIAARYQGETPPGESGVTEYFDEDVSVADLDRLNAHLRGAP